MTKKLRIESLASGATAVVRLLEKEAPQTCRLIWDSLEQPMVTEGIHAMWVGPELMFVMPKENQRGDPTKLPQENATAFPYPGDVLFMYVPAHGSKYYHDPIRDKPIWDFFIIYGPDPILGGGSCTVWGVVDEGLAALAEESKRIRVEGTKPFRVERLP